MPSELLDFSGGGAAAGVADAIADEKKSGTADDAKVVAAGMGIADIDSSGKA